jgi:hypothetical protein
MPPARIVPVQVASLQKGPRAAISGPGTADRVLEELMADRRQLEPIGDHDAGGHRLHQAPDAEESARPAREDRHRRAVEPALRQRGQHAGQLAIERRPLGLREPGEDRPDQIVEERSVVVTA